MPVDLTRLTEGWLELESDPGLFMLLLEDFGVKNVQVEEIYDITKPFDGPVYGFIFLFRWIEERRSRRKITDQNDMFLKEEAVVNNIFFAQQMVPNSCATHALLSVLLNCPKIHLGDTLARLKADTDGMTPENKGWAIANTPELAKAHNSHAIPQGKTYMEKNSASATVTSCRYTGEAFHFVCYVPIQDRLIELDGLKPYPIDHGPCDNNEDWTEKFRKVMTERLGVAGGEPCHDIRFNLMALIPDRRIALSHKLNMLKTNREIVVNALKELVHKNESKKCNYKDDEKDAKESSDLCSNPSLTESEAAFLNDLKLDKVEQDETEDNKQDENTFKGETVQFETNNTIQPTSPNNLNFSSNQIVTLSNIKNDLEFSSKENIAPTFKLDNKGSLCVNSADYSTPLSIKTSPNPSISDTDTSSEIGSAFSSPLALGWGWNSCQSSPCSKDFKKYVVLRMDDDKSESPPGCTLGLVPVKRMSTQMQSNGLKNDELKPERSPASVPSDIHTEKIINCKPKDADAMTTLLLKYPVLREHHTFAPKDLLALLKNVETEIDNCEASLRDENDKRCKYKIDDCRRTHPYDNFLCAFLLMLVNQGKLKELFEQRLKRPVIPAHRLKKILIIKKSYNNKAIRKRRKGKTKHRRRH